MGTRFYPRLKAEYSVVELAPEENMEKLDII